MRNNSGVPLGADIFSTLSLTAGGWCTGGEIADDGCLVTRTDTYSGYVKKTTDAAWRDLFDVGTTVTAAEVTVGGVVLPTGTYDVSICKSNSNYIAAIMYGRLFLSSNNGNTMAYNSAFGAFTSSYDQVPNSDPARMCLRRMCYDPDNTSILGVVLKGLGLRYTTNGGTTWTTHATIPAPATGNKGVAIACDRFSAQVGGARQIWYVMIEGQGIYQSITGIGGVYTLMAAQPATTYSAMYVHPANGYLWAAAGNGESGGQLYRWNGTTWATITGVTDAKAICGKPSNADVIYALSGGSNFRGSVNATAATPTFYVNSTTGIRVAPTAPWHAWTNENYISNGDAVYDPAADKVHVFAGLGTWRVDSIPATSGASVTFTSTSDGIENIVGMMVQTTRTSGNIMMCVQDRTCFLKTRDGREIVPGVHGFNASASITHSNCADYAPENENWIMATNTGDGQKIGYSSDLGATWTVCATRPPELTGTNKPGGGTIIVGAVGKALIIPQSDTRPYYTLDYGSTWNTITLIGAESENQATGWIHANYSLHTIRAVADKDNPGHYYIYNVGTGSGGPTDLALRGIWKSTDYGATFNRIKSTLIDTYVRDFWNSKLKQVPGKPGHFWFTAGPVGVVGDAPATNQMFVSTDYMATWTAIPNASVREVVDMGFGKAAGGASYPAIYAFAENSGLYRCIDFDPGSIGSETWTLITQFPDGNLDYVHSVNGDMGVYGLAYLAMSGSGFKKVEKVHTLRIT